MITIDTVRPNRIRSNLSIFEKISFLTYGWCSFHILKLIFRPCYLNFYIYTAASDTALSCVLLRRTLNMCALLCAS